MKCFYEPNQDAVGSCKSCGRGLSMEHLTEMDKGLACKGRCEEDVRAVTALVDRGISSASAHRQMIKSSSSSGYGTGVFMTVIGMIFAYNGLRQPDLDSRFYLGAGFVTYGIWTLVRAYRHASIVAKLPDPEEK